MSREKETFRQELEQINIRFGGKAILSLEDVKRYTGRSDNWCRQHLGVKAGGITAVMLANRLANL